MDAGVVLRERRLKTRDGLFCACSDGEREGWGNFSLPGFSLETLDEAQALLAWAAPGAMAKRRAANAAVGGFRGELRWRNCAASCRRRRTIARRRSAPATGRAVRQAFADARRESR
jgi:hypothetical protein